MRIGICESVEHVRVQLMHWIEQYAALYGCKLELAAYDTVPKLLAAMSLIRFDLILLSMDGPEGFLTARRIRETYSKIKLVFITDTPQYAVMGVRIHLTDYIVKPVAFKHMARALKLAGVGKGG